MRFTGTTPLRVLRLHILIDPLPRILRKKTPEGLCDRRYQYAIFDSQVRGDLGVEFLRIFRRRDEPRR